MKACIFATPPKFNNSGEESNGSNMKYSEAPQRMTQSPERDGTSTPAVVYVVDDERIILDTLAAILNKRGFNALRFTNPLEALAAAETRKPDILISDVMMPEMNGIELAIQIMSMAPSCRVVLFSGQASTSDMLKDARSRGHDFLLLTKPVHPADLLAAIGPVAVRFDS
jgi:CheY-like chemotaxis protein